MSPDRDLVTLDTPTLQRTQDYLMTAIDKAAAIGASTVAGPMYSPTGVTGIIEPDQRRRMIERLAENLVPVLHHARSAGIRLAIEPLNRFETSLFNTVAQLQELLDVVAHPNLGMLLDTFHMNIEEQDIPSAIRAAGSSLFHFHACGNDRGAPGNGSMPWIEIAAALRDIDYRGPLVIESFVGTNRIIAAAAAIWRPLAANQDAIAINGLAFLRAL
jgi:D-psicose/D-tagatose/L-ribulose 3-epimerase